MGVLSRRRLAFVLAVVIAAVLRAVPAAAAGKPGYPNAIVWSGPLVANHLRLLQPTELAPRQIVHPIARRLAMISAGSSRFV